MKKLNLCAYEAHCLIHGGIHLELQIKYYILQHFIGTACLFSLRIFIGIVAQTIAITYTLKIPIKSS